MDSSDKISSPRKHPTPSRLSADSPTSLPAADGSCPASCIIAAADTSSTAAADSPRPKPMSASASSTCSTANSASSASVASNSQSSNPPSSHTSTTNAPAEKMSSELPTKTAASAVAVSLSPSVNPPSGMTPSPRLTVTSSISPASSLPQNAETSSPSAVTPSNVADNTGASSSSSSSSSTALAIVVIGMAGSGKSTFVGGLQRYLASAGKRVYTINLDPAAIALPYESVNIDIRDTVNYKRVMQHYRLGPNGGILTALNLFATKFGDVLTLLEQRKHTHDYILLDTPGQIEAFTWSASGSIILESLAASLPTCICYILDTPRCSRPVTFMSNMLYSCSVLYKARLPFVGVFNKTDVASHLLCQKWMTDYEAFQEALLTDDTYLASLSRSSALMLVEFYSIIQTAGVSSVTNAGMKGLEQLLDKCRIEYETDFLPFLREKRKASEAKAKAHAEKQFAKFMKDHGSPASAGVSETAAQQLTSNPSANAKGALSCLEALEITSVKRTDEEAHT